MKRVKNPALVNQVKCAWCGRAINAVPMKRVIVPELVHPQCLGRMEKSREKLKKLGVVVGGAA